MSDIKSNYILSLIHVKDDLYSLKTEDDKEYRCRKLKSEDPTCSHFEIENIPKEQIEEIKKGGKYISVGFNYDTYLDYLKDNVDPNARIEKIPDGVRYSYKTGTLRKKNHKPIKIPDNLEIVSTKKMYIEDTQPALDDYVLASMEAKRLKDRYEK